MIQLAMQLLPVALIAATPLLLAVLGEIVLQRSGLINLGLEGLMLVAALAAALGVALSGSVAVGFASAIAASLLLAALFGLMTLELRSDPIVTGTAMNFLAAGLTGLIYRTAMTPGNTLTSPEPASSHALTAGSLLQGFPSLEESVVWFAWLLIPVLTSLFLSKTIAGLRLRACGENSEAARSAGVPVKAYRWAALVSEAVLAGVGGGFLSLVLSPGFAENMVAGRGFIALAVVIFARWTASGAVAGVALFGLSVGVQYVLQGENSGVSYHLLLAFPYVLTLAILAGAGRLIQPPEELGSAR